MPNIAADGSSAECSGPRPARPIRALSVSEGSIQPRVSVPDVASALEDLRRAHEGREEAHIESPLPLSDEETSAIAARLGKQLGVTLVPEVTVKPELIGGVRVRVGDTLFDATVAGSLESLREHLMKGSAL